MFNWELEINEMELPELREGAPAYGPTVRVRIDRYDAEQGRFLDSGETVDVRFPRPIPLAEYIDNDML